VRRFVVWLLMLAALGVIAYGISVPHSQRPCLVTPKDNCDQLTTNETHM